jgi:hypothetical protein
MSPAGARKASTFKAALGIAHEIRAFLTVVGKPNNSLCLAEYAYDLLG